MLDVEMTNMLFRMWPVRPLTDQQSVVNTIILIALLEILLKTSSTDKRAGRSTHV